MSTPPAVEVRPASPGDAAALARLLGELGYPATPEQVLARLQRVAGDDTYGAFVAVVDGEVAGFLGLQRGWAFEHERPYARLLTLVVDGRMRRRGVGARLVEQAKAWGRQTGAYALLLNTNLRREEAHRFYEALGFSRTGWRYIFALE